MKKFFVLFLAVNMFVINISIAQQNKIDVGIEGGAGISLLFGNEYTESYDSPALAYNGGLFLQYNFPKNFSIRTNIWLDKKGTARAGNELDNNNNTVAFTTTNNLNYLTMPVLFRYTKGISTFGKKIDYFVNAGPWVGILLSQSTVTDGISSSRVNNTANYKSSDMGVAAGLGFVFPVKENLAFSFEARDNLGLANISAVPVYKDGAVKTNSTSFLFGLVFKLGSRQAETSK